ncbi:MAG: hypothetical protein RIR26_2978, partial [Pseudomonadota bacterium]
VPHLKVTDWLSEYYRCPKDAIDKSCTRVLNKRQPAGYEVNIETFPLALSNHALPQNFSSAPTHVRLSHRLSPQEIKFLDQLASKDAPALALAGHLNCIEQTCRPENSGWPLKKVSFGGKNWLQFENKISPEGVFGPQSLPPVIVGQSQLNRVFALQPAPHQGRLLELGLSLLAPLFAFAFAIWAGNPPLLISLSQLLTARAFWHLSTTDALSKESLFFTEISLQASLAVSTFIYGWLTYTMLDFLSRLWRTRQPSTFHAITASALITALTFLTSFSFPAGTNAAVQMIRSQEALLLLCAGLFLGSLGLSLHPKTKSWRWTAWLHRQATVTENQGETSRFWWSLSGVFLLSAIFAAGPLLANDSHNNFNWSTLFFPALSLCTVMSFQPRYTWADIQIEKDALQQQENLVKFISQIGNTRHRSQAISLVMNFCNRELPKLGFESPTFSEQQPTVPETAVPSASEVSISMPVEVNQNCFGWISTCAKKSTGFTAVGEKMLEALTTSLGHQLESLNRCQTLEQQVALGQKFIPSNLIKVFSVEEPHKIDSSREFVFKGIHICIAVRQTNSELRRVPSDTASSAESLQLTEFIIRTAEQCGGILIRHETARWTVVFNDSVHNAFQWIKDTQMALKQWSTQHNLGEGAAREFNFGAHVAPVTLRFLEVSGALQPWIQGDTEGSAAALAHAANQYAARIVCSHELMCTLKTAQGNQDLPAGLRPLDRVWNNKKTATLDVFEYFGADTEGTRLRKQNNVALFSEGIMHYLDGHFDDAREKMKQIVAADPSDTEAQRLLNALSGGEELRAA